ncbi:MAG TPA: hypothetical protein VGX97_08320, partial [bacterium]|nr:hypothetical protein [bacterium]
MTNCVGTPGLVETRQGQQQRNFQLVVAKADGSVEHYVRQNDVAPFPWRLVSTFGAGDAVADVSLFQSALPGSPLEVTGITQGGHAIFHYQETVKISSLGVAEAWRKETVVNDSR